MITDTDAVTGLGEAVQGFLGGALVSGGLMLFLFSKTLWLADAAFLVMGIVCMADAAFPFGRQPHMTSLAGGFIAGFAAILACAAFGVSHYLCVATLAAFLVMLIARRRRSPGGKKGFKTPGS